MPIYNAKLIRCGRVVGIAELDAPDDEMALSEANDGIDVLKGEWVEVKKKTSKQEAGNE